MSSSQIRLIVVAVCLLGASVYVAEASRAEVLPPREPLALLPMSVGGWIGQRDADFTPDVLAILGVDDYITRTYTQDRWPLGLYVGYHTSQRQGDTIHSPLNCLPGSGWTMTDRGDITVPRPHTGAFIANRYVIQKGIDRQVVLYWYQGRGRVIANEFANRFWLMFDAAVRHRSSGALVRVNAPVRSATGSLASADAAVAEFTRALFPRLSSSLP